MQQITGIQIGGLVVSLFSLVLAITSLVISRLSWLQSNRPIVTARIASHSGGNKGTALNIIVENTGNRPAKNIRLRTAKEIIGLRFSDIEKERRNYSDAIMRVFSKEGIIPVLANGKSVSNSFGFMSIGNENSTWKEASKIEIEIQYEDLEGRGYSHKNPLLIAPDEGFAGHFWEKQ